MAAAIMATMQLIFNTRSETLACATANYAGWVCRQACEAVCSAHVYQSGLVIDKIRRSTWPWGLRDVGGSCWAYAIKLLHVQVTKPSGSSTIELSLSSQPSFPSCTIRDTETPACRNWIRVCWTADSTWGCWEDLRRGAQARAGDGLI